MAIDKIYTDGYSVIKHYESQSLTSNIRDFITDGIDPVIFNSYSTNSLSSVITDSKLTDTKFSEVLYSVLGTPKLSMFSDGYGHFIILNRDILNTDPTLTVDYGVPGIFANGSNDMLETSKGFTTCFLSDPFTSETTEDVSNVYYTIYANNDGIQKLTLDLTQPYVTAAGDEIIDCQNTTDPDFGNTTNNTLLLTHHGLKDATDDLHGEINTEDPGSAGVWYSNFSKNIGYNYALTKHIVVPIKHSAVPTNDEKVYLGLIAFDKDIDAFQFRFINETAASSTTSYGKYSNGYNENYTSLKGYNNMNSPLNSDDTYICTFTGFSFNSVSNLEGLKTTAFKMWDNSSKTFNIQDVDPGNSWDMLYQQLPVEFGNRLLPLTDYTILNTLFQGSSDATSEWGNSTAEDKNTNVGYFNIAYGTKHGFILMRLHSYAPILLSPQNADGIEVHVPGGKWDYQASDGTFPFQEAGGFTPISMAFSPDNNYLYTVIAHPEDRTIRYVCIYDMTNPDADAITSSATIIENPFDAQLKSVSLLPNGKILISSVSSGEYIITNGLSDTLLGVLSINQKIDSEYNFNVNHSYFLHSTATDTNSWKGSEDPLTSTDAVSLSATPGLTPVALTPQGFLDIENPINKLTTTELFNTDNSNTWVNSVTITDASKIALVSAKIEIIEGSTHLEVFNPTTGSIYLNEVLNSEYIYEDFYTNPTSLSYVKLASPLNHYAIVINYIDDNPLSSDYLGFFGPAQNVNQSSAFVGYAYGVVCIVDISDSANINVITDMKLTSAGTYNENLTFPLATNFSMLNDTSGINLFPQTYGNTRFVSLKDDDTYAIELYNTDGDVNNNMSDVVLTLNLRAQINIFNISNPASSVGSQLTYDTSTKIITPPSSPDNSNFSYFLPDAFGTVGDTGGNEPTHSFSCVSHDASKLAAIYYNETAFSLSILALDPTTSVATNVEAILDVSASEAVLSQLNHGNGYVISGVEFSANKRNLYILIVQGTTSTPGRKFLVIKIDIGTNTDPTLVYEIGTPSIVYVNSYYYSPVVGQSAAYQDFNLPAGVSGDLLSDSTFQDNTSIVGMFKGLDHNIYFLTDATDNPALGVIVNPDHIENSNNSNTKFIKAGIPLT